MNNIWQESKTLIGKGNLEKALSLILDEVDETLKNEVILYQTRLHHLKREERIFQKNILVEKLQLSNAVLEFIMINDANRTPLSILDPAVHRMERLRKKIIGIYDLLAEWEEKKAYAENPSEVKRSEIEINRLMTIIKEQNRELENLKRTTKRG